MFSLQLTNKLLGDHGYCHNRGRTIMTKGVTDTQESDGICQSQSKELWYIGGISLHPN